MIHLSNPVRLAVRQEFESQFNAQLVLACAPLGITPFEIDFATEGTFWDAPLSIEVLMMYLQETPSGIPAMCLYWDDLRNSGRPAAFDGIVHLAGGVYLRFGLDTRDFESMPAAVQAAIVGVIQESSTDDWGGGTYMSDLSIRAGDIIYENGSFYRIIQYQLSFQVTAN